MKLWLCVLSALLLAGCTAGTDVPGSVTPTAVPTPAATETGETAEVAATPAPTADAVQPPQGLVETGAAMVQKCFPAARRSRCLIVAAATAIGTTTQMVFRGRLPTRCERNMPVSCKPAAMV